jgi:3-oxoacyl-[acyl-carrier protein] reductase
MGLLDGRTAVVTGGAQGIGLEIARAFVQNGARVVIGDVDGAAADKAVAELGGADVAVGAACDVRRAAELEALLDLATMRTMTEEQFDAVVEVNLKGVWLGTRAAAARMREVRRGSIVNISSLSGKVGMAGQTNYSAAKAGVVGLTKAAAKELAHLGVRVNAVQPGLIRTPMTEAMPSKAWDQKMSEIPMGRPGEPHEVAGVVVFLASELSSYMTGTVHEVTGGRFM